MTEQEKRIIMVILYHSIIFVLKGSDSLMSLAISSDGEGRSGSGETQARPKATGPMTEKYSLFLYLNEKLLIGRKVAGATLEG